MFILTVADPIAALVGIRYGQLRYVIAGGEKSAEGSVAFLIVTFLSANVLLLLFTNTGRAETLLISLVLAILATGLEAVGRRGLDNLYVPLGTGLCLKTLLELDVTGLTAFLGLTGILILFAISSLSAWNLWNGRAHPPKTPEFKEAV